MNDLPIRVLYDDQGFFENMGGVSRYFTELMKHLPTDITWKLPLASTSNLYLKDPPFSLPAHKMTVQDFILTWCHGYCFPGVSHVYHLCAQLFPRVFPSGEWNNQKSVRAAIRKGDFDIYHLTGPHWVRDDWKIVGGKKPIIVTVHDLIPDLLGHNRRIMRNRAEVLKAATHIIAVSENTKCDVMREYGVPDSKITVIYHGYMSRAITSDNKDANSFASGEPYLLFVGKRSGYKNFDWFIRAVAPLLQNGLRVLCTGAPFTTHETTLIKELGVADRVEQRFMSDKDLFSAFSSALAFVYPSRYEGFGIPILDAFAAGCPVILARASCFQEVAGEAAMYFDLDGTEGLRTQVQMLMNSDSKARRAELAARGHNRLKFFSWERCAEQTAEVYRQAMGI